MCEFGGVRVFRLVTIYNINLARAVLYQFVYACNSLTRHFRYMASYGIIKHYVLSVPMQARDNE